MRSRARRVGLTDIALQGSYLRFAPVSLPESRQVRVQRLYPKTVLKPQVRTMLVPVPKTAAVGGRPLARRGPARLVRRTRQGECSMGVQ